MARKKSMFDVNPYELFDTKMGDPHDIHALHAQQMYGNYYGECYQAIRAIIDYAHKCDRDFERILKHNPEITKKLYALIDNYEKRSDVRNHAPAPENGCNGVSDEEYEDALALIEEFGGPDELSDEERDDYNDAVEKVKRYEQG